eukprot:TRINITY_DN3526_c0_g1_i3.p1 TRINITY_DN3526_c0_g1~~TRINITY_DN3526_c0_g1_i3.p1  ORF type:complete len:225 (+),score=33.23 TRINITY_DN3526_c0_g1_i3:424-1098(+)
MSRSNQAVPLLPTQSQSHTRHHGHRRPRNHSLSSPSSPSFSSASSLSSSFSSLSSTRQRRSIRRRIVILLLMVSAFALLSFFFHRTFRLPIGLGSAPYTPASDYSGSSGRLPPKSLKRKLWFQPMLLLLRVVHGGGDGSTTAAAAQGKGAMTQLTGAAATAPTITSTTTRIGRRRSLASPISASFGTSVAGDAVVVMEECLNTEQGRRLLTDDRGVCVSAVVIA